jgi:hypothetical protein
VRSSASALRVRAADEEAICIMSPLDALEKVPLDQRAAIVLASWYNARPCSE